MHSSGCFDEGEVDTVAVPVGEGVGDAVAEGVVGYLSQLAVVHMDIL